MCPYCDFAVAVRRDPPHAEYCSALLTEWAARAPGEAPRTIYFGGGTPAMWAPAELRRFIASVDRSAAVEVTIEANPHDISPATLDAWHDCGIDRVSVGVQSFDDDMLAELGRDHDAATARAAVARLIEDGRFRTSLDLIYGGPRYSTAVLRDDVAWAGRLGPNHISAYQLTVEERTVFGRRARAGALALPDHDALADLGDELVKLLADAGYARYEVSSYGRGGDVGIHNSAYWQGVPYIGLGTGAASLTLAGSGNALRQRNRRGLREYLAAPTNPAEIEALDAREHLGERLFLGARTTLGVEWAALRSQFATVGEGTWQRVDAAVAVLRDRGWLDSDATTLRAAAHGLDFADAMAEELWRAVGEA